MALLGFVKSLSCLCSFSSLLSRCQDYIFGLLLQALREGIEKRIEDLERELEDLRKQKQALQQKNVLLEMGKSTLSLTAIHKQLEVSA